MNSKVSSRLPRLVRLPPIRFWTSISRRSVGRSGWQISAVLSPRGPTRATTHLMRRSVEVYAKAPGQRTTVAHVSVGDGTTKDSTTVYDGRAGWISMPNTLVPMLVLTGGNLDGAKVDADFSFPGRIKQALTNWRACFPERTIDDHEVQIVQGISAGKSLVKLYFDRKSGLLLRQVRYADTVVGLNPTQVDYSDYRELSGVKLPFR